MSARAEKWILTPTAGATETYNWYSGPGQPDNGFVTTLTAGLGINGEGARLKLNGNVSVSEYIYSGQSQNNSFAPNVSLAGHLEAIENFFFVDATANVAQTFISPFGPQPGNITTPTNNRYTSESYSVSPYVRGTFGPDVSYSVRDDFFWSTARSFGASSLTVPSTYWNNLDATVTAGRGAGNVAVEYSRQFYDSGIPTGTYTIQLVRGIASYRLDPQLDASLRGGYEDDHFPEASTLGNSTEGPFYGAGAHWRPTDRTDLNGYWEHHFYGSSYSWQITHRLPNVALSANFTRGLSSFPELALLIPAGVPLAQFLDAAFTTRIPDPAERAQAVAQFLAQSGLPPTLASPLNVYASTITLQNTASVSAAWVGALNGLDCSIFRVESQTVFGQGSELPPAFQVGTNYTETGAGVSYSHRLSGSTNLVVTTTYTRTTPNNTDSSVGNLRSNNFNTFVTMNKQFTPKTNGSIGVSYFVFETPGSGVGRQTTVSAYASISHTF